VGSLFKLARKHEPAWCLLCFLLPWCNSCQRQGNIRQPASVKDRDLCVIIDMRGLEVRVPYEITEVVTISDGFVVTRFAHQG
jgi:hypothetical protein